MNILFISSKNCIASDLARLLVLEGHNVRLFIDDHLRKENLDGMVAKTTDWKNDLAWVGKEGLVVFDDVGYQTVQKELRRQGYSVFGGSSVSDDLEFSRQYAQSIFKQYGLASLPTHDFDDLDQCQKFLETSDKLWVIKQNDHKLNANYVTEVENNLDAIDLLILYREKFQDRFKKVSIQEKVTGVEIGVGRYFNGQDWAGPVEINFEHKRFFNGEIGPLTTEMGTLAWYEDGSKSKLFKRTIALMKPFLQEIDFRGDFEINFIANENGLFPLEATPRLGSPIIYLQNELQISPWGEFLKCVADGKEYDMKWRQGFGIVVLLALPPFPYAANIPEVSMKGARVYLANLDAESKNHVYFEGVKFLPGNRNSYVISDCEGYALYVAAALPTIQEARDKVYGIIKDIHIPKMFYRTDIGSRFLEKDRLLLEKWGYL